MNKWMIWRGIFHPLFLVQHPYDMYLWLSPLTLRNSPLHGLLHGSTPPLKPGYRSCSGGLQILQRPGNKISIFGCFFVVLDFFPSPGSMGLVYKPYIWLVLMVKYMVNVGKYTIHGKMLWVCIICKSWWKAVQGKEMKQRWKMATVLAGDFCRHLVTGNNRSKEESCSGGKDIFANHLHFCCPGQAEEGTNETIQSILANSSQCFVCFSFWQVC